VVPELVKATSSDEEVEEFKRRLFEAPPPPANQRKKILYADSLAKSLREQLGRRMVNGQRQDAIN
jgi:hypothetical protein